MFDTIKSGNRKYRMAGIDIDHTLVDEDKNISPENAAAVRMLVQAGVIVVLTTGRIYEHTTRYYRELGLTGPVVTSDGASVRVPFRRTLQERTLARPVSLDILQTASELKVTALAFYRGGIRITSQNDWNDNMDRHRRELKIVKRGFPTRIGDRDLEKILIFCPDSGRLRAFDEVVAPKLVGVATEIRNTQTLEYTDFGVTKVTGLQKVCEHLSVDPSEVLYFGDGNNDVDALAWAGCGVAMHHGTERARAAAKYVAPASPLAANLAAAISLVL